MLSLWHGSIDSPRASVTSYGPWRNSVTWDDFVSLSESIDTSTPMGKMIFTVLGAVAELERNLIKERVHMGTIGSTSKDVDAMGHPYAWNAPLPSLLLVENHCGGYRLAFRVSSFGSLRHRLAVSGNDVLTRNMVLRTGLSHFKADRIRIDSLNGKNVEC
jgi:hypothetical protein